jgi:hypothetical protein
LNSREDTGKREPCQRGRPRKITDEGRGAIRELIRRAGSIQAAKSEILQRYPLLKRHDDKKTTDAIRHYAKTEIFEQHTATSLAARSAFMQACHAQGFNASSLLNKLDDVISHEGIDYQSAKELQMSLEPYTSRGVALRSLQAMLSRLIRRGVLDYRPSPRGRLYTFPCEKASAACSMDAGTKCRTKVDNGDAETEVQPGVQS